MPTEVETITGMYNEVLALNRILSRDLEMEKKKNIELNDIYNSIKDGKLRDKLLSLQEEKENLEERIVSLLTEVDNYKLQSNLGVRSISFDSLNLPKDLAVLHIKFEDSAPLTQNTCSILNDGLKRYFKKCEYILMTPKSIDITHITADEWEKFGLVSKRKLSTTELETLHLINSNKSLCEEVHRLTKEVEQSDSFIKQQRSELLKTASDLVLLQLEINEFKRGIWCKLKDRLHYYFYWFCQLFQ